MDSEDLKRRHVEEVRQRILKRVDTYMEFGATREEAEQFALNNEDTVILSDDDYYLKINEVQGKYRFKTVMGLFEFMLEERDPRMDDQPDGGLPLYVEEFRNK